MQNNDLKILYQKGINAIRTNNILQQREVLIEMKNKLGFEYSIDVNLRLQRKNPNGQILPLADLTPDEVYTNLYEYCQILYNKVHREQPYSVTIFAINRLTPTERGFSLTQILFENKNQVLSVSGLLKAITYSLDFIHKITGENIEQYKQGILVLKGLDKILNNKPDENNTLDNLGYAIEIFAEVLKCNYPEQREQISDMTSCISLAIDFLTYNNN
jgi:hypothetical protein